MKCKHCKVKNVNRPRGLCYHCYYTPSILEQYPSTHKNAPKYTPETEPTMAELDAMIAEQSKTLPRGWVKGEQS